MVALILLFIPPLPDHCLSPVCVHVQNTYVQTNTATIATGRSIQRFLTDAFWVHVQCGWPLLGSLPHWRWFDSSHGTTTSQLLWAEWLPPVLCQDFHNFRLAKATQITGFLFTWTMSRSATFPRDEIRTSSPSNSTIAFRCREGQELTSVTHTAGIHTLAKVPKTSTGPKNPTPPPVPRPISRYTIWKMVQLFSFRMFTWSCEFNVSLSIGSAKSSIGAHLSLFTGRSN